MSPPADSDELVVDQQQRDVGERVAEGGHLPVDDRLHLVGGVDQAGCRAGSRRARSPSCARSRHRRARRASRGSSVVGVAAAGGWRSPRAAGPTGAPAARGSPAGRPNSPSPTAAGSTACSRASTSITAGAMPAVPPRRSARQLRGGAVRRAVDPLHHVERRAQHVGVGAVRERPRHRDVGVGERRHRRELAAHVVRGGLHVTERRASDDPPGRAVGDLVGQVRLPAGDQRPGEVAGDLTGTFGVVPAPVGVEVEAGQVGHGLTHDRAPT